MADPNQGHAGPKEALSVVSELMRPLIEQANELTAAVHQDGLDRRNENRRILGVAVVLLLLLVLNVSVLFQNRHRSAQNGQIIRNSAATSEQIADCTTVGGRCYQQSQKNTQAILSQLLVVNTYVVQCAKTTNTDDELNACVASRLKAAGLPVPDAITKGAAVNAGPTPSAAQDDDPTP